MSIRTSNPRSVRFLAGLATGALIVCAMGFATPAKAQLFGKKKPKEDYSVTMPAPAPIAARPANGGIFQASEGYAALYEGQRARRVGDDRSPRDARVRHPR